MGNIYSNHGFLKFKPTWMKLSPLNKCYLFSSQRLTQPGTWRKRDSSGVTSGDGIWPLGNWRRSVFGNCHLKCVDFFTWCKTWWFSRKLCIFFQKAPWKIKAKNISHMYIYNMWLSCGTIWYSCIQLITRASFFTWTWTLCSTVDPSQIIPAMPWESNHGHGWFFRFTMV